MSFEKADRNKVPPEIIIDDKSFVFVKERDFGQGLLYKDASSYLRIGDGETIENELRIHRNFEGVGFPVAKILKEGIYKGQNFYREENIGEIPFHVLFQKETVESGEISQETFEKFLKIVAKCVDAQLHNAQVSTRDDLEGYFRTWFFEDVSNEAPHLASLFEAAKQKARDILSSFPTVLSHNDFNAYNILPEGVIDFSYGSNMPLGYDWVSLLKHQNFFPVSDAFEASQKYAFSNEQELALFALFRTAFNKRNLDFDAVISTLYLGRMTWSAAHMQKYPKLQKWRFENLEKLLKEYLAAV